MRQVTEKLYEALFMNSQKGAVVFNMEGQIIEANPVAEQLFGQCKTELLQQKITDLVDICHRERIWEICNELMLNNKKTEEERLLTLTDHRLNGERLVLGMYFNNHIKAPDGSILFAAVVIDETQKWGDKHKLYESLERFKKSFNSNPVAQMIVNAQTHVITDANKKFLELLGDARENLVGVTIEAAGLKHCGDEPDNSLFSFPEKRADNCETILRVKHGAVINILQFYVAIKVNNVPHELWSIIDISGQKNAEQNLLVANEDLEQKVKERTRDLTLMLEREKSLNDLKTRFISMASHEFRTPLTTILVSTGLLETHILRNDPERCGKHISRIKSSVKLLTEILEDFLSLDKIEHGQIKPFNSVFNLNDFAENIVEKVHSSLKKGQKIEYTITGSESVSQDKNILQGMILNLLSNAIKYSGEHTTISWMLTVTKNKLTIAVADNGIGIPADVQPHIFSRFFRARNAEVIQGTGLGLNIVRNYTDLLDGKISFVSTEGVGTTFTLELPLVEGVTGS